jgi:hypothetical protein
MDGLMDGWKGKGVYRVSSIVAMIACEGWDRR